MEKCGWQDYRVIVFSVWDMFLLEVMLFWMFHHILFLCPHSCVCWRLAEWTTFMDLCKKSAVGWEASFLGIGMPPPDLTAHKHTGSCDLSPPMATWTFGNICSTAPGEGPRYTAWWCRWEGRETWARWPPAGTPPLGWRHTAGCFGNLFPCRWSCSILKTAGFTFNITLN